MAENPRTTAAYEPTQVGDTSNCATEVIGLELDIFGKKVNFPTRVGRGQARLTDIVPLARTLCTKIADVVVERIRSDGGRIPCRKSCSACCSSYLVPLSVPEAIRLKEEISAAPGYRRISMERACILAARRILRQKPPKTFIHQTPEVSAVSQADLNLLSSWYASLNIACPFLYNRVCTIYEQRPLACREHFVKGSARACKSHRGVAEVVEMPVQMPNALAQLASELEGASVEAVILPLVLVWCEENQQRAEQTWPIMVMVRRFIEIIKAMAQKESSAVLCK